MSWDRNIAIGLIVLIVTILVYVIVLIYKKVTKFEYKLKNIPKFSIDHHFDVVPARADIDNRFDCNAESLHKCLLDDETTLFGCKELVVKCHHFEKDVDYINNNKKTTIPKNDDPNEGYALAITTISEACNAYHGDFTLVAANSEATEYMLICTCKNPGYIGNHDLLGNCTTVFICEGKIDDIEKPLDQINCQCGVREKSTRYDDGLPVCKSLTVDEANKMYSDWTNLIPFSSTRQMEVSKFNPTISGNLKTTRLLDPCRNAIDDTSIEIQNGKYDPVNGRCQVLDYGLPISNGMLDHHPVEDSEKIKAVSSDCIVNTGKYVKLRFSDDIAGTRRIAAIVTQGVKPISNDNNDPIVLVPTPGIGIGGNSQINISAQQKVMYGPKCDGDWPTYYCLVAQYYDHDEQTLPQPGHRPCPNAFLWNQETWNNAEYLFRDGVEVDENGFFFKNDAFRKVSSIKPYGVQWVADGHPQFYSGLISFTSQSDYKIHSEVMT